MGGKLSPNKGTSNKKETDTGVSGGEVEGQSPPLARACVNKYARVYARILRNRATFGLQKDLRALFSY